MPDHPLAARQRHDRFLRQALTTGEVWGLQNAEGWCLSASTSEGNAERQIMPFWSDRASAQACAQDDWASYAPIAIPLAEFWEQWLPGLAEDGLLVGTNWDAQLVGVETEPLQLQAELEQARRKKITPAEQREAG